MKNKKKYVAVSIILNLTMAFLLLSKNDTLADLGLCFVFINFFYTVFMIYKFKEPETV
jgi:hypothetical protein